MLNKICFWFYKKYLESEIKKNYSKSILKYTKSIEKQILNLEYNHSEVEEVLNAFKKLSAEFKDLKASFIEHSKWEGEVSGLQSRVRLLEENRKQKK